MESRRISKQRQVNDAFAVFSKFMDTINKTVKKILFIGRFQAAEIMILSLLETTQTYTHICAFVDIANHSGLFASVNNLCDLSR